jgi:hypothetical protein
MSASLLMLARRWRGSAVAMVGLQRMGDEGI